MCCDSWGHKESDTTELNVYPEPGPILGAKDTLVNMAGTVLALKELTSWLEGRGEFQ